MRRAILLTISFTLVVALMAWASYRELANSDLDSYATLAYAQTGHSLPAHWPKFDWTTYPGGTLGFEARLPFYQSRVLYTGLLAVGIRVGIEPDRGAGVLNAMGVLLLWVGATLIALHAIPRLEYAATLSSSAILVSHVSAVIDRGTPDLLAAGLATATLGLSLRQRVVPAWTLAVLAVLTRPDSLPIVIASQFPLFLDAASGTRLQRIHVGLAGVGLACLAIGISVWSDHPGWASLFTQTFLYPVIDPTAAFSVSSSDYLTQLVRAFKTTPSLNAFTVSGVSLAMAVGLWINQPRHSFFGVGLALLGAIAFRFLLFPWGFNRMFVGTEVIGVVLVVAALAHRSDAPK